MPLLGLFPADHHPLLFHQPPFLSSPASAPLPSHIKRTNIYPTTPSKHLEFLIARPPPSSLPRPHAILFIHGGFGSASVWIPFLTYFSQKHDYICYAVSIRGHGESWKPGYMEMVWGTGIRAVSADAKFAIEEVKRIHRAEMEVRGDEDLVLVGHSAGGGVCQYILSEMDVKVRGLVLLSSFPNFGGWRVYLNWAILDPLFFVRFLFRDLTHSRSPLSSTSLVHRAFFSPTYPISANPSFEKNIPEYESLIWPMSMMFRFINLGNVLQNVVGWRNKVTEEERNIGQNLLVIAGRDDKLMSSNLMERMTGEYRVKREEMMRCEEKGRKSTVDIRTWDGADREKGIGFEIVNGGHHVQNDLWWEDCAERILVFVEQL